LTSLACFTTARRSSARGRKTKLVPAGRGPFATWEDAATDALKLKGLHKITDWSIERMGYEGERFNGLGYVGKGVNSAYLWAGSTLEQSGKYVADHVWNKSFDDPQIGVMDSYQAAL
jgi:lysozyme family protein